MGETYVEATFEGAVADENYTYDMVLVFKVPSADKKGNFPGLPAITGPDIVFRLNKAGLRTKLYQSVGHDEIYVLVGASEKRLQLEADRIDLDVALETEATLEEAYKAGLRLAKATRDRDERSTLISENIWSHIYGKFDRDERKIKLYRRYDGGDMHKNSFFRTNDRINLIVSIAEAPEKLRGAGLAFGKIKAQKNSTLLAFFPLHEQSKKAELKEKWLNWRGSWNQPLDEIRDYFGEKVAMYFAFLQYYTKSLLLPAILGIFFFLNQLVSGLSAASGTWLMGIFIVIWATSFLENWKRMEAHFRVRWGMTQFKTKEQPRPEYHGDWIYSPIDGHLEHYFPLWKKFIRVASSQSVVVTFILIVISCVAGMFLVRSRAGDDTNAQIAGAFANVVQIQIFNFLYGKISTRLNEFENHKTDSEYENALIAKSFLFKFVNSYNSMFYIAFFKRFIDSCGPASENCMLDLRVQLTTVFTTMILLNNFLEVVLPYFRGEQKSKSESKGMNEGVIKTFPEEEFELNQYESTFDDFDELAIQFGFVCLFIVVFPLTPLLAFLNNAIEVRVDSTKLLMLNRRPEPRGAYDIGTWFDIFTIIATISILTNVILVSFFVSDIPNHFATTFESRVLVAILAEHLIMVAKLFLQYIIPDEPADVTGHKARQEYLVGILINDASEEADDDFVVEATTDGAVKHPGGETFSLKDIPDKLVHDSHFTFTV